MYQVLTETVWDGKPDEYHTENINSLQESCHRRQSGCEGLQYSHSLWYLWLQSSKKKLNKMDFKENQSVYENAQAVK